MRVRVPDAVAGTPLVHCPDGERRPVRVEDGERFVEFDDRAAGADLADAWIDRYDEYDDGMTSSDDGASESYTCAGETSAGESCSREVDEPGGYCYQHG